MEETIKSKTEKLVNDYYTISSKKTIDSIIGFVGFVIYIVAAIYIFNLLTNISALMSGISLMIFIAGFIYIFRLVNSIDRIYIKKGMTVALLLLIISPFLAFGACFISVFNQL